MIESVEVESVKIRVENVQVKNDNIIVFCRTSIGDFKGIWTQKEEPHIGEEYHAELGIEELLYEIAVSAVNDYSVSTKDCQIDFRGLCEGADEEVMYIRLATDWIEMVDLIDGIRIGDDFVTFSADYRKIKIYPYTI